MKTCSGCRETKNAELFPGFGRRCRACRSAALALWKAARPGYDQQWRKDNPGKTRAAERRYYAKNRDKRIALSNRIHKRRRWEIKEIVLRHYSNGKMSCACCGEREPKFLTLDHINGGGAAHRRELNKNGMAYLAWLYSHGLPVGYQVLCWNCNSTKGVYGKCPHADAADSIWAEVAFARVGAV